jgi:tetrahydromethanopterin S-methyltransferase subunit G
MSNCLAALATVIAVFVMLRAERKDMAKVSDLARIEGRIDALDTKVESRIDALETKMGTRIEALETKLGNRIEALDSKMSARLDTVVLELGKAFGRPAS